MSAPADPGLPFDQAMRATERTAGPGSLAEQPTPAIDWLVEHGMTSLAVHAERRLLELAAEAAGPGISKPLRV